MVFPPDHFIITPQGFPHYVLADCGFGRTTADSFSRDIGSDVTAKAGLGQAVIQ